MYVTSVDLSVVVPSADIDFDAADVVGGNGDVVRSDFDIDVVDKWYDFDAGGVDAGVNVGAPVGAGVDTDVAN